VDSDEDDYLDDELFRTTSKQKVVEPTFETNIDGVDEFIEDTTELTLNKSNNNNNNIALWSGMTNAVLQASGPL